MTAMWSELMTASLHKLQNTNTKMTLQAQLEPVSLTIATGTVGYVNKVMYAYMLPKYFPYGTVFFVLLITR
jgi:hypothetical protein